MTKREKAIEILMEGPLALSADAAGSILDACDVMFGKPKKGQKTEGARIWDTYDAAFARRYGHKPKRNAATNAQASQIASRLGLEDGCKVVEYYLRSTDAFYLRNVHPLAFCLRDAETLYAKMTTGSNMTRKAAEKVESAGATVNASESYLRRKHAEEQGEAL